MTTSIDQPAKIAGILMMVNVIAVYAYGLASKGVYPPSHPWSGISLIVLSLSLILTRRSRVNRVTRLGLVLVVLSSSVWTWTALL
jgi:hypothetical protein